MHLHQFLLIVHVLEHLFRSEELTHFCQQSDHQHTYMSLSVTHTCHCRSPAPARSSAPPPSSSLNQKGSASKHGWRWLMCKKRFLLKDQSVKSDKARASAVNTEIRVLASLDHVENRGKWRSGGAKPRSCSVRRVQICMGQDGWLFWWDFESDFRSCKHQVNHTMKRNFVGILFSPLCLSAVSASPGIIKIRGSFPLCFWRSASGRLNPQSFCVLMWRQPATV